MFDLSDKSSILSAAIPTNNSFSDIKIRWNANRENIKTVQKGIGMYGKVSGDGRAIVASKAIDAVDIILADKKDNVKLESMVKKSVSDDLKIENSEFISKGDGTGMEGAMLSLNASDSKDAISKAVSAYSDKLKSDGRDIGMRLFSSKCNRLDSGRFNVSLIMDNVKEPTGFLKDNRLETDLFFKPMVRGHLLGKNELTEKNIFKESQIRKDAIHGAPPILLPEMSADEQYIVRMGQGLKRGEKFGDVEKSVVGSLLKQFGTARIANVLEKNSPGFIDKKAGSFVKTIMAVNEEHVVKPKVRTKVNTRSNDRGGRE